MASPDSLSAVDHIVSIAQGIIGGVLSGVVTFWALFSGSKKEMNRQIQDLDDKVDLHAHEDAQRHNDHAIILSTLTVRQQYAEELLEEVKASIKESATHGADEVKRHVDRVVNEIRQWRQ